MLFTEGIEASLRDRNQPVITTLDFHLLTQGLFSDRHWRGEGLKRLPSQWDQRRMHNMLLRLIKRGTLSVDRDFGSDVFRVRSVEGAGTAEEVACLVDPFCYVSYNSAIHLHRLRRGSAKPLHLSTPEARQWKVRRAEQVQALDSDKEGFRPAYPRVHFNERLRRRSILVHETTTPATFVQMGPIRTSTLGATFADMLSEPAFCGGMAAVLKVWDRHARRYVDEIVSALDARSAKIVKVRAGYIFTERLGIETHEILSWLAFAQRGGSRRLDPERPYAPTFSERWMLSLNAEVTRDG